MKKLGSFDWFIFASVIGILCFGLLIIRSIVPELFGYQLTYALLGLIFFFVFSFIDWRIYIKYSWSFYAFSIILLCLTILFGTISRGAARWIFIFQPAEIVKPFLIIFLSWFYDTFGINTRSTLYGIVIILVPTILIVIQPDLGSGIIIIAFSLGLLIASGIRIRFLLGAGLVFIASLPLFWKILHEYQQKRILTFLNPFSDPLHSGYNVIQSITAIGSGKFLGWGLGRGPQSHLRFLPENHTDFIFASLTEELGFIGALILLFLFGVLFWRILRIAKKSSQQAAFLIAIGVFCLIFSQFFINIGMNLGILPVTGITLPLVSYGGNSLISILVCLGLVESLSRFIKENEVKYIL